MDKLSIKFLEKRGIESDPRKKFQISFGDGPAGHWLTQPHN
jgi:hypothetical protein